MQMWTSVYLKLAYQINQFWMTLGSQDKIPKNGTYSLNNILRTWKKE